METVVTGFTAMGGHCELRFCAADPAVAEAAAAAAIAEVARIEAKYSRYRSDSIVGRINAAAGSGVRIECDDETRQLLDYAGMLYDASGGRFDISSGVLRRAWDFGRARLHDPDVLAGLRALIGWPRVERDDTGIRLPVAGMEIDFGGFGKEYAADRAAAVAAGRGIAHGYVNLGGDLRVIGPQPDGAPWRIGIRDPRRPAALVASIPVASGGLATSGDYERFFELDGRRYCHILDPRSGMPVEHWRSVSVLAPLALVAGSHATIAMLSGADALDWLAAQGVAYLAIDAGGRIHSSDGGEPDAAAVVSP